MEPQLLCGWTCKAGRCRQSRGITWTHVRVLTGPGTAATGRRRSLCSTVAPSSCTSSSLTPRVSWRFVQRARASSRWVYWWYLTVFGTSSPPPPPPPILKPKCLAAIGNVNKECHLIHFIISDIDFENFDNDVRNH